MTDLIIRVESIIYNIISTDLILSMVINNVLHGKDFISHGSTYTILISFSLHNHIGNTDQ